MWRRQQPYWHAVFAIVWTAAVVVTLVDDPGLLGRGPSLVLLGVIAAAYAVLGTRAMTHRDLRWAVAYQVIAWSALVAIQWVDPSTQAWLLYFTLFPQLWAMVPTRWAVIGTVLVVTAFSLVRWAQLDFSSDSLTEILISSTISMGSPPGAPMPLRRSPWIGQAGRPHPVRMSLLSATASPLASAVAKAIRSRRRRISPRRAGKRFRTIRPRYNARESAAGRISTKTAARSGRSPPPRSPCTSPS